MSKHSKPSHRALNYRERMAIAVSVVASGCVFLLAGVLALPSAGAADMLSPIELAQAQKANCQLLAASATSSAQRTRANQCVADQTRILTLLQPSTPPATTTPGPTTSVPPTTTPPVTTTPPATTQPPATTPPATTPPPASSYPTPATVGIPAGTTLTNDSRCTLSTPNEVIVGRKFGCRLTIAAAGVVIRSSWLTHGLDNWTAGGGRGFTLEDSLIGQTTGCEGSGDFGVGATDYAARRNLVMGMTDGFRVSGRTSVRIVIEDNYVRPCNVAGAHTDGVQDDENLAPATIRHNTIDLRGLASTTAAVFWPDTGSVTIADNLLAGGSWAISMTGAAGQSVAGNAFISGAWEYDARNVVNCGSVAWSGNTLVTVDSAYRVTGTVGALPCKSTP